MNVRLVSALVLFSSLVGASGDEARLALFRDQVRPILQRCVGCHGGDEPAGGLDLTTRAGALKGGESGPALKPGQSKDSLIHGMTASKAMPPKNPLPPEQVALLRKWIDDGATWDGVIERKKKPGGEEPRKASLDWWSLQPVSRPAVPKVEGASNPIDAFVRAKLQAAGLAPTGQVDRITLIRRLHLALIGLPPTPEEIDAFVRDTRPQALEILVDRLLASPHYGERWGRHWLDVVRFGESQGFERDKLRDHAWRYRDYVIRSFNEDKPYPQFVREQLAGDVLDGATRDSITATGFLVAGPWDEVGATQQGALMRKRAREEELEDMVSAVGQTFLGLTVNCARCHNHKFDPITQRDYYRLKAALEGVFPGDRPLTAPALSRDQAEAARKLQEERDRLEKQIAAIEAEGRAKVKPGQPASERLPRPMARWGFEGDARDSLGGLHGQLLGGATIRNGRLRLDGRSAFVRTAPLGRDVKARTLEVWVSPANLNQRGGAAMTLQTADGKVFDSIVLGERQPGHWMAGSDFFRRTRDLNAPAETAGPGELVHLAISYAEDGRIAVYRNGRPHGVSYVPPGENATPRTYPARGSVLLFGLRHTGAGNGFFAGEVEEARLYDRSLSAEEVAASFRAGVESVPLEQILAALSPEQRRQREQLLAELARKPITIPTAGPAPLAYAVNPRTPEPTFVLLRGDVEKQGERVSAGGLSSIKTPSPEWGVSVEAPEGERRRRLADWIAHPDNPLTARVMVNRVWHYHFGRGLVSTPNDFGFNGGQPTHPELLDWLASEFNRSGGSVKHLHRLICLSSLYQQTSALDPKAAGVDADNRLLWRFPLRRLEAEAVRDAMLAASGELNRSVGGPSFRPFVVRVFNSHFYDLTDPEGPEFQRRTVYRMNVGSARSPLLEAFDCPDPSVKTPQRGTTTTPMQALGLMNNSFVLRQARRFAERARREAGPDIVSQVERVHRLALGRAPTTKEREEATSLVREHGLESLCWVMLNASEFLYVR